MKDVKQIASELTPDQERVLRLIARLAEQGYDAPPGHLAHELGMDLDRVGRVLQELSGLGLVLSKDGRAPRC